MKIWLPPKQWERRYKKFQHRTFMELYAEFKRRLGRFAKLKDGTNSSYTPTEEDLAVAPQLEKDSDELSYVIAGMLGYWLLRKPDIVLTIHGYYNAVNQFNDQQFRLVVKDALGITLPPNQTAPYKAELVTQTSVLMDKLKPGADIFREETYLPGVKANWTATQETIIDKAAKEAIVNSELAIRRGLVTSLTEDAILGAISNIFNGTDKRQQRSADDGINSLNTQLTEKRQVSIGATEYIWRTQRDERVRGDPHGIYPESRPSHYERDNQIFNWNNPPVDGHPGEAPGCRCYAVIKLPR